MKNKTYDILKDIALIGVPALGVFVNTLGKTWGIPYTNEITTTISSFGVLLGSILKFSSIKYNKKESDK